jgi:hypothetical protein
MKPEPGRSPPFLRSGPAERPAHARPRSRARSAQRRGPAAWPALPPRALSLSLSLTSRPRMSSPTSRPSLTPACSLALPRWPAGDRSFSRQTDPTITIYTTPRFRFARKHHGSSSGDSSPTTVAARRPRCPVTRWYNVVAVKLVRGK